MTTGANQQANGERRGADNDQPDMGRYVSALSNMVYKGIMEETAPFDLTPLEVQLMMICEERGECPAYQIAQLLPVDASRVSRLVTGLADMGVLRRRRLRNDRRIVMLRLTPQGQKKLTEINAKLQSFYDKLTKGLNKRELRSFASIAQRLMANYEAMESA